MPKVSDTKRDRAKKLFELIKSGPAFIQDNPGFSSSYELWVNSWILNDLVDLVPALREIRDEGNKCKHCGKRPQVCSDTESGVPGSCVAVCTVACKKALKYHGITRLRAIQAWNADNPEPRSELIQAIQGRRR